MSKLTPKFPDRYWDPTYLVQAFLADFYANSGWKTIELVPPPVEKVRGEIDELLRKQSDPERSVRTPEILLEAQGLSPVFHRMLMFTPKSHPSTYTLYLLAITLALPAVIHLKARYLRPRPCQLEPKLRPIIEIPGHPAYPSGHSTQMHLVAHLLAELRPNARKELFAAAGRIAENREWAGVHYASDTAAGKLLASELFKRISAQFPEAIEAASIEWA